MAYSRGGVSARPRPWLLWLAAFAAFSVLALTGVVPRGPIGDWTTPLWADIVLAPFSGVVMLMASAVAVAAALRGRLDPRIARPALRLVAALIVATAIEVVIKAAFPGSAGVLGAVSIGPIEFGFYPSGHTLRSTIVAIALARMVPIGTARWLFLIIPVAVGTMLVAAGGHFPVDIAGGALLGAAAAAWALDPRARGSSRA